MFGLSQLTIISLVFSMERSLTISILLVGDAVAVKANIGTQGTIARNS